MSTAVIAAVTIDIDGTFFAQLFIFWAVMGFLYVTLFKNYLQTHEQRQEMSEGAREEAKEAESLAEKHRKEYEKKKREIRRDAQDVLESLRDEGRKQKNNMIGEMRDELDEKLEAERGKIQESVSQAQDKIEKRSEKLATLMVDKVLLEN